MNMNISLSSMKLLFSILFFLKKKEKHFDLKKNEPKDS